MKIKFILLLILTVFAIATDAQCPLGFNYQTVIRSADGNPLFNTQVNMRFTIDDSINPGIPEFQEVKILNTDMFGHVACIIGDGLDDFVNLSAVNWPTGHKYMQVELDMSGTGAYTNMGTEILASVPYALYSDYAGKGGYPQHYIGEYYGGGIIFSVTDNGQHGLIADSNDLLNGIDTIAWAYADTVSTNATLQGTGGGYINTERAVVNLGAGNYAANLCANYTGGGYGDWFLPSINELNLLYQQQQAIGNLNAAAVYWSSTETAAAIAAAVNFGTGATTDILKSTTGNVRAVRVF